MSDIRKLLRFVKPYQKVAVFSLVMLVAMVFLDLAIPRLVEQIIDKGIKLKDMSVVLKTSILMLGISLLSTIVAVLNSNSSVRVGESVARDLR
jgi:ATP-binding cassette subfamily B protein